jgi:hypothetical protein
MTITATPSQIAYSGDGLTVAFAIPFVFDTSADLKVILTDTSGTPTEQVTGFAISGGAGSTGTCTFSVAPTSGYKVTILDDPELTQPVDYTDNDAFAAATHEGALDRCERQIKRLHQRVDRSLRVADGDDSSGDQLLVPVESTRAGKFLAFDASGQPTASSGTGGGDSALRTDLAATIAAADGARLVGFRRNAAGSIASAVSSVLSREIWVEDFGTNVTPGTTDMLTAINNAITAANALGGGTVRIGQGTFFHSAAITMKSYVRLKGCGKETTILKSTHAGDGMVMTNTINTSSPALTEILDLQLWNTNGANTGGGTVDICGTYAYWCNVKVKGFKYGMILDQTELSEVDRCEFFQNLQGCLWLTNGDDHSPGAAGGFTNRISVSHCQFNDTPIAVIDDGGASHTFADNNFNLCGNHFRIADCFNITIRGNEFESATGDNIIFRSTTLGGDAVGGSNLAIIEGNFFSPVAHCVDVAVGALTSLVAIGNRFISSAATIIGTTNINSVFAAGNVDSNVGTIFDGTAGHHFEFGVAKGFVPFVDDLRLAGALTQTRFGVTYSASMTIDASTGNFAEITANNGTAFTINAPTNPIASQALNVTIRNASGGALGVATWNAVFKMAAWVQPANGFSRSITFLYDGVNWVEKNRLTADVPN